MNKHKRLFLVLVYLTILSFSLYAIIQIRLYINNENITEADGRFIFWLFNSRPLSHEKFLLLKLTLFVITAALSYVLMISNYFLYSHPNIEERIIKKANIEIKKELSK